MLTEQNAIQSPPKRRGTVSRPSRAEPDRAERPEVNTGGAAKRAMDLAISLAALPALLPLFALIAVGVKLSSPGPVFYLGLRTGRGGRPFRIVKFRTMSVDAERTGGGTTALDDPRVFRFGRILRKYKLDELPQVFNVLAGQMSLVGPRPELPVYTDLYQGDELAILAVRPGITDYSSIEFSSLDEIVGAENADRVFEEQVLARKNRLRVKYALERSLGGDVALIFRTFLCLVRKAFR